MAGPTSDTLNNNFGHTFMWEGLGQFDFVIPEAGSYGTSVQVTLPKDSQLVIQLAYNGTIYYTGAPGATGFQIKAQEPVPKGSVSSWIFSSSAPQDQGLNKIKAVITLTGGV